MNNSLLKYGLLFVFLVLLQVLVVNNTLFSGYINPHIYILFIFAFPLNKEKTPFLLLSFFLGLSIDFFSNSGGINAAATLFIAYFRLPFLHSIQKKTEFDYLLFNIKELNIIQSFTYVFTLTFLHHIIVFFLAYYKADGFLSMLYDPVLLSSILTAILIGLSISLFFSNSKK